MAHHFDVSLKLLFLNSTGLVARALFGGPIEDWVNAELPRVQNPRVDPVARTADGFFAACGGGEPLWPRHRAAYGEYYLGLHRRLNQHVQQVVLYVGREPLAAGASFVTPAMRFDFQLLDMRDFEGEPLLMKRRAAYWLARLYPAAWRERYGDEFDALVEESRPGWRGLFDIGWGALAMQWRTGLVVSSTALLFALLGIAVAVPVALMLPKSFVSTGALKIKAPASTAIAEQVAALQQRTLRRDHLIGLIERHQLFVGERGRLPMEDLVERMQQLIQITGLGPVSGGREAAFRVRFADGDAAKSTLVTRELMTMLIDENLHVKALDPALEVLDLPSAPQPASPNRTAIVFAGLAGGALIGMLVALTRRAAAQWRTGLDWRSKALVAALAGFILAVPLSQFISDRFLSMAAIQAPAGSDKNAVTRAVQSALNDGKLASLMERHRLYPTNGRGEPGGELLREFKQNISVTGLGPVLEGRHMTFRVGFKDGDRSRAQLVTRELMTMLIEEYSRQNPGTPGLEVLDLASRPEQPVFPNRPVIWFFGLMVGAAVGLLHSLVRFFARSGQSSPNLRPSPQR